MKIEEVNKFLKKYDFIEYGTKYKISHPENDDILNNKCIDKRYSLSKLPIDYYIINIDILSDMGKKEYFAFADTDTSEKVLVFSVTFSMDSQAWICQGDFIRKPEQLNKTFLKLKKALEILIKK